MRYISEADLIAIDTWACENQQDLLNTILMKCRELNQWQPIETAPKDETTIMLYFPGKPPCVGFWSYVSRNWCLFSAYRETRPTHWAEILEPPFHEDK